MKIDAESIVKETIDIFEKSGAADIYRSCKYLIEDEDYKDLHPSFLTPLDIKIDPDEFNKEILNYQDTFEQWGQDHTHLPRYGAALINLHGTIIKDDPINGSLMAWNRDHPDQPLIETDCQTPTKLLLLKSLAPLDIFKGHWCRSNILKWGETAKFLPHIDTIVPSPWIRLWASMSNDVTLRFHNKETGCLEPVDFELGRLYIIDTSLVHDATATGDGVYQLFLSVLPTARNLIINNTTH
jgi:hypothetical protein